LRQKAATVIAAQDGAAKYARARKAKEQEMNSNGMRVAVGVAVVVVAVVLLVVLKNDDSGSTTTSSANGKPLTIVVKHGKPVGGVQQLTYNEGERVRFKVDSDVSDEVHMHGYDIMKDVKAGGSVSFNFPATIEGVFEAELENRKEQILELTVNP
jgi:heme/copper-type cytochrome/quinol oxidase subunit 2